ncbi:hypothetical protein GCM10011514_14710 [Emticicia aquatilis]|uniref:Uncharacterized protein n=1 Tax=Emticicia aquatilis TaxID=1537369 RepID=A0A916YLG1_9BACT|nr:hypothetical protein GCM10011514_14710 [Emticicia aquatilis]
MLESNLNNKFSMIGITGFEEIIPFMVDKCFNRVFEEITNFIVFNLILIHTNLIKRTGILLSFG